MQLSEVESARGLSSREGYTAQSIATEWVYVGPCKGDGSKLHSLSNTSTTIGFVLNASPRDPLGAAVLEMIAILTRDNLGRTPSEYTCRFALETAVPRQPAK